MLNRALLAALAAAPLLSTPAVRAQDTVPSSSPLLHGVLELSLVDAIRMGLENNLSVEVERYGPILAGLDEEIAWGAYDPELFGEFGYSDVKSPNTNALFNQNPVNLRRETGGFAGFRGQLPLLSTEYSAQFDGSRESTNSSIIALSPELRSSWNLAVTQPLLKDLIWNQPWTRVKTNRLLHESSEHQFRQVVMDVVQSIENAYWQLIADEEEVRVSEKSLETARALLDQTKIRYEVGVVSKVEVTEAEAGLEARQFNLIVATNRYRNQQDVLIDLILGPGLRSTSTFEIVPTDRPEEFTEFEIDVERAVLRAFENRPELEAARKEVERQTVQQQFAWNQRLPSLNAELSFGQEGASGDQNSLFDLCRFNPTAPGCPGTPPDVSQGGFGNTYDDYSDNPQFTARAIFSIPIPNTQARKTYDRRRFELQRAQTQLRQLEQQVILEVRQAARNLRASQEGIESAMRATEAAQEQLRAERIRHEYGESTPFEVLQREEDLVDRDVERIESYRAYRSSVTALDRAQGTILSSRNIEIEEVTALR